MQPLPSNSFPVALFLENSDVGKAAEAALEKKCGKPILDPGRTGLFLQFSHTVGQTTVAIEVKKQTSTFCTSITSEKTVPKIIFTFGRAVAVNPILRIGDLVLVDNPDDSSFARRLARKSPTFFDEINGLPEISADSVDPTLMLKPVLALLSKGPKTGREMRDQLNLSNDDWKAVLNTILLPNENKYWTRDARYCFTLTTQGEMEASKGDAEETPQPRKPSILFGRSHCTDGMTTDRTERNVDLIDQLSTVAFKSPEVKDDIPTLCVASVKCFQNQDPEAKSPYLRAIGEAFVEFMLQVAVKFKSMS